MADNNQDVGRSSSRIKEENPGMWQDFYSEARPMLRVSTYANDFNTWVADAWTITEVGTSLQNLKDERNGVLDLTSGATEDNGNNAQLGGTSDTETTGESWCPAAGKNLWFECRFKTDEVTQHDIFVGLHVQDTTVIASKGSDYIGFKTDDGDALLDFENSASSVANLNAAVLTLVNATYYKVGFKVTGLEKIEYYVNDVLKGTVTTNIPTTEMKLTLAQLTGEGVAHTLSVDYVVVGQDR